MTRIWLAALCVAAAGVGMWQAAIDAPTTDEGVEITDGLAAVRRHDLRLNPQHPPLAKALAAIPVLFARPPLPGGFAWRAGKWRRYSGVFFDTLRTRAAIRKVTTLARIVPVLELVLSVLTIYALAIRLAGPPGGLLAAALWLLDPFVIGVGHVDGNDLPATLSALGLALALVRWLERRELRRLLAVGLACGAALMVRDTGPLLLATALVTVGVAARDVRPALIAAAVAVACVWLTYLVLDPSFTVRHLNVLPQRYVDGFDVLADAHDHAAPAFLLGHHYYGGRWWYWPGSMLIKLPLTLLAAYGLAPWFMRRLPADGRRVLWTIVPAAVAIAAFTVYEPVDLGLRYMLPVLALLTVCTAPLVRARRALPVLLGAGSAAFAVSSLPHPTSWVSPVFAHGYRVATADNLDWGQDAFRLQDWAKGRRAWVGCYSPWLRCAGSIPGAHVLHHDTPRAAVHGLVVVSPTHIYLHQWTPWIRAFKPAGTVAGTQLLYRVP